MIFNQIFNTFPDFTIISENASLVDLLKRITFIHLNFNYLIHLICLYFHNLQNGVLLLVKEQIW